MTGLIEQWCAQFHFLFIDLRSDYAKYDCRQLKTSPTDPCHPNQLGHKIAAETIRERLRKGDFIK